MTEQRPSGTQWRIEHDGQAATIVEIGGGLREYTLAGQSLVDGYAEDELCPAASGQILAPWPNRLRDGRYRFGQGSYQVPLSEPATGNAIHGLVHWLRWECVEQRADSVTVAVELPAQPGYPWPLRIEVEWSLGPGGLTAAHTVTNRAGEDAPFGLGAHPYLHIPGVPVEELRLTVPARSRLLLDARSLPIGTARLAGGSLDFTAGKAIGQAALDVAFGDVVRDGQGGSAVRLEAPDGRALQVWADENFGWWQVFTADTLPAPRRRRAVAVEPMTCPPDALRSGRDLIILAPSETWRGKWGIQPSM